MGRVVLLSLLFMLFRLPVLEAAEARHLPQPPGAGAGPSAPSPGPSGFAAPTVRVRDLARIESVRVNQLTGYGLVVGLNGTGDTAQSPFTLQAVMADPAGDPVTANRQSAQRFNVRDAGTYLSRKAESMLEKVGPR